MLRKIVALFVMILTITLTIPRLSISESEIIRIEMPKKQASTIARPKPKPVSNNNPLPEETAGNNTNKGLAVEDHAYVYYTDGPDLWSIHKDNATATRLEKEVYPVNLQLLDDQIYYINEDDHHIYSTQKTGGQSRKISDDKAYSINLHNRRIYFMDRYNNLSISSMSLDGRDKQVIKEVVANDMVIYNNYIYYITRDGDLGKIRVDGANDEILQRAIVQFDIAKTGIYYTYDPRIASNPKGLYHLKFDDSKETQILTETPYSFNVHNNRIYYNHPSKLSLYSMGLDGTDKIEVTGVNSTQINIAGQYIFYKNLEDGKKNYRVDLDGSNRVALRDVTLITNVMDLSREVDALEGKVIAPKLKRTYTKAQEIIAQIIKPEMSDHEKAKTIHDYVVNTSHYDVEAAERFLDGEDSDANAFTAYGVLINQRGVCQGYAEAMQVLLSIAGVESRLVIGDAMGDDGVYVPHMWNIVVIDGSHYMIDATWDDPVGPRDVLLHDYFLVSSQMLRQTHRWAYDEYPECYAYEK